MKKISAWLLSLTMACSLIPANAFAETVEAPAADNEYEAETVEAVEENEYATETVESVSEVPEEEEVYIFEDTEEPAYEEGEVEDSKEIHYVLMNIPYADFYAQEGLSEQVDVVSTATTSKFKSTTGLARGTYNDGTNILGVTYPVAMDADTYADLGANKISAEGDLGTAASYAFKDYEGTPSAYETLTYADGTYTFATVAPEKSAEGLSITEYTTTGSYGNYQITLDGVKTAGTIRDEAATIAGVVITTSDGNRYPMYMLDNIWLGTRVPNVEIAWSVKDAPAMYKGHGNGPQFYQYDMNGKTITDVKLITDIGVYHISQDLPLGKYTEDSKVEVADATTLDSKVAFHVALPADFDAEYTVNMEGAEVDVANSQIILPADAAPGSYMLTASDKNGVYAPVIGSFALKAYALVNIPYSYFYTSDIKNDVAVDVYTSATLSKSKQTGGLAGSTYHTEDGSEVTGVTYPALVNSLADLTKVESKEALATAASWSYTLLDEAPAQYKEVTVQNRRGNISYQVGAVNGELLTAEGASATLTTESRYGDYQMDFSGLFTKTGRDGSVTEQGLIPSDAVTYGAYVVTTDGAGYGMRTLENIWKPSGSLAWCTGFTPVVHGCPTAPAHYESMMGKTIDYVVYLTDKGNYKIDTINQGYVALKSKETEVKVADNYISKGETQTTITLPEGFEPEYTFTGESFAISQDAKTITYPASTASGTYSMTISDKAGKYANVTTSFVLKADTIPASYDAASASLAKTSGCTEEDFASYIGKISSVTVDGTAYGKSSFHGSYAVTIVKEDGSLDLAAVDKDGAPIFGEKLHTVSIPVTGYDDLTFEVDCRKVQNITAANKVTRTYGGKAFPLNAKTDGDGIFTYKSSNAKVVTVSKAGVATIKGAGTAVVTVYASATETYKGAEKKVTVVVKKAANPVKYKVSSKTYKVKKVKKKKQSFTIGVSKNQGKVTYKSSSKKVTVTKAGKVTVKKGTRKGTYKITVTVAGNANYNAASKTIKVVVK